MAPNLSSRDRVSEFDSPQCRKLRAKLSSAIQVIVVST